jgi:Rod binding domain-containing protein
MWKGWRMSIEKATMKPAIFSVPQKQELDRKRLKEACQDFESFLTQDLLKSMDESVMRAEEPDQARETYEGMFRETLSSELSRHSKGGIADLLYQQLVPLLQSRT